MNTKRNIKFSKIRGGSAPPMPGASNMPPMPGAAPPSNTKGPGSGNSPGGNAPPMPGANTGSPGGNAPPMPGANTGSPGGNAPPMPGANTGTPGGNTRGPGGNTRGPGGNTRGPGGNNRGPGGNTRGPGGNTGANTPKTNNAGNTPKGNNAGNNNNSKGALNKMKNTLDNITDKGSDLLDNTGDLVNSVKDGKYNKWGFIFVVGISLILIIHLISYIVSNYYKKVDKSPLLIPHTKNGKHTVIISQDPESVNYIPIKRSEDENGIELTYSFWTLILDYDYKNGEWKHLFHKGNSTSYPNRAPGVWLHPNENKMRVYMNTFDNILEYVDVDDIPVKKWFCTTIVLQNSKSHTDKELDVNPSNAPSHILDVYINGNLKKSKLINSIPRQNNGDLYVNLFGGFNGYLSKLQYFSYAADYKDITSYLKSGPSEMSAQDTGEMPPYLDDKWWFKD